MTHYLPSFRTVHFNVSAIMKHTYLLPFIISLSLSSIPVCAQTADDTESITKSLIECHYVLFTLAVLNKLPPLTTDEENAENALTERIRTAIPRISTKSNTIRLSGLVAIENQELMAEITSDGLSVARAQELKSKFSAFCTPVLLLAESLPNVR